jgi:hypothetical protein
VISRIAQLGQPCEHGGKIIRITETQIIKEFLHRTSTALGLIE